MINIQGLSVAYGNKTALREVDLSFPEGRVSVLIGPSGCGKSTLLRSINRLVEPLGGSISVGGENTDSLDPLLLRRSIGYAIQGVGLFPHLTVARNIAAVPEILGWSRSHISARVHELLSLVQLDPLEYQDKYPSQLSGGEAQRVGVARALGADPPILLMDEPFGAVDPLVREILQDEFIRIQRRLKKTVVFVTHDLDEALRLADHLVLLKEGQVVQSGSPVEILSAPANDFAAQFLGQDREIKRLVLFTADRLIKSADTSGRVPQPGETVWEVDRGGRPTSGTSHRAGKTVRRVVGRFTVFPHSSLKECLSGMLGLGLWALPVVDDDGVLVGEVRYSDIEALSDES